MLDDWKTYITRDLPQVGPITQATIDCTTKNCNRFRGSVRAASSRIITDDEYQMRRQSVMDKKLP